MGKFEDDAFRSFVRLFADIELQPYWLGKQAFLLEDNLKQYVDARPGVIESAGTYLGKVAGKRFEAGLALLALLAPHSKKTIIVNDKAEWLFVCGRDLMPEGITATGSNLKIGDMVLVQNSRNQNLGLGRIDGPLTGTRACVRNMLDRGDFLRRER